jgi:uncharacterized protein YbjT (DUF2867 family)
MIVVTGAGGRVGGLVAAELARRGVPYRAVTRDIGHVPDLGGAEIALAGYDRPDALADALDPGDRVFMVSMHEPPERRLALHRAFLDVARERRVGRIVYLSVLGAAPDATFLHARSHGETERLLAASGIPFTAVRNGMYADEIATWFDAEGRTTGPGGDGAVSLTYRPELADAIVALLVEPAHDPRTLVTITCPAALTLAELAAAASQVTGDPYRYDPLDREDWLANRRTLRRPAWSIEAGISYYDSVARGEAGIVGDDYRSLTGREPLTIAEIIELKRAEMPLAHTVADRPA